MLRILYYIMRSFMTDYLSIPDTCKFGIKIKLQYPVFYSCITVICNCHISISGYLDNKRCILIAAYYVGRPDAGCKVCIVAFSLIEDNTKNCIVPARTFIDILSKVRL